MSYLGSSFPNDNQPLYNKVHVVEIKGSVFETRSVNIVIKKDIEGSLLIKIRDTNSFLFNYTALIQRNQFPQMKKEQSLDIDFDEFETHLLEMLSLHSNKEMCLKRSRFLKLELCTDGSKCRLIFYEKSRIKCLVFLTIEMMITNQKELLEEMEMNMKVLQETNLNLARQVSSITERLKHKENQIIQQTVLAKELEQHCMQDMKNINRIFLFSLRQCESLLAEKVLEVSGRIVKMVSDINIVKNESHLKSASSARLLETMENLRIENLENVSVISQLKIDCANYEKRNRDLEDEVFKLRQSRNENETKIRDLQNKLEDYRQDLENSAVILSKKTEAYNELKQDMEQASKLIKNYNKHYDLKAQEVEEYKEVMKAKDDMIKEQLLQNNQLFKEYQEYKIHFNKEEMDKLLSELEIDKAKIETLEKEKREMVKRNDYTASTNNNIYENYQLEPGLFF